MWKKIKDWIKKNWIALLAFISSIIAFIFCRQSKRDRLLTEHTERVDEFRSVTSECRDSITESRIENKQSSDRIESGIRESEEIRRTNDTISGEIKSARETISGLQQSINDRINQLKQSEEN